MTGASALLRDRFEMDDWDADPELQGQNDPGGPGRTVSGDPRRDL